MTATLLNSLLRALLRWGAALVFCLPLRHRPHFWARACGMLLPLLLLAQLLDPLAQSTTLWQQQLLLLVLYVSFFALLGGMIYLCTDINKKGALYCAVWSLLIAQCAYESWCFLELQFTRYGHPLNMASPWAVLVQLLSGAIFFAAVYLLLARQLPYKGEYHIGPRQLFSASFIGILFMVQAAVLDNARAEHTPLSLTVTILIGQFYFITLLYFQSELFKKSAMEKEMNELNLLYERQRQQYQVARQNVQIINKRCHELKVQIANLRRERLKTLFSGTGSTDPDVPADSRKHGMGIGLSVCAAIIKAHGGEIKAESRVGEGTTIRFWLETEEIEMEDAEDEQ